MVKQNSIKFGTICPFVQKLTYRPRSNHFDFFKKIWMMCDKMTLGNTVEKPEQVN